MERRQHTREFKIEAVRLVKERGVSLAQASRDLDIHENLLRTWVKRFEKDAGQAFPGHGVMKPEQAEIALTVDTMTLDALVHVRLPG